ncbi:MAG: hypothetical protein ACOC2N_00435 [Spirochaetota bacterium]
MDTDRPGERTADVLEGLGYALGPLDTAAELLGHATLFLELYDHPNEVHDLLEAITAHPRSLRADGRQYEDDPSAHSHRLWPRGARRSSHNPPRRGESARRLVRAYLNT